MTRKRVISIIISAAMMANGAGALAAEISNCLISTLLRLFRRMSSCAAKL